MFENDSSKRVVYSDFNDTTQIDSIYYFKHFQDTFLLIDRLYINSQHVEDKINITEFRTDSGNFVKFILPNPEGTWIMVALCDSTYQKIDTIIYGPSEHVDHRFILIPAPNERRLYGYINDWDIFAIADTIGAIGRQIDKRYIFEFELKSYQQ